MFGDCEVVRTGRRGGEEVQRLRHRIFRKRSVGEKLDERRKLFMRMRRR